MMSSHSGFNFTQIHPKCENVPVNADYIVRLAQEHDYPEIDALQVRHLFDNLSESEKKDGFLSALMSSEQIDAIAKDPGIAVSYRGSELVGFFCASHPHQWNGNPIIQALISTLSAPSVLGDRLHLDTTCLFGPMCVKPHARGTGVLLQLYQLISDSVRDRFATAIAFIAVENPRSLAAVSKFGWTPAARFLHNGREFHALFHNLTP
jgi:hypothetical protein